MRNKLSISLRIIILLVIIIITFFSCNILPMSVNNYYLEKYSLEIDEPKIEIDLINNETQIILKWDSNKLTEYQIQISETDSFINIIEDILIDKKTYSYSCPFRDVDEYYWRIRLKNENNEWEKWYIADAIYIDIYSEDSPLVKWIYDYGYGDVVNASIADDGIIYLASKSLLGIIAMSSDGMELWRNYKQATSHDLSTPLIGTDGNICLADNWGYLTSYNANGDINYSINVTDSYYGLTTPAIDNNGTIYTTNAYFSAFYALSSDGELEVSEQILDEQGTSKPAIGADGTVYFTTNKALHAYTPEGVEQWSVSLGGTDSSPAIDSEGIIYVGSYSGYLYAINPDGTIKWKFLAGGKIYSSPVLDFDGNLYFGCNDSKLYALSSTGNEIWTYTTGDSILSSPAIASEGVVFFGSNDGYVYALRLDGTLCWKYNTGYEIESSPVISNNGTIIISNENKTFAFNSFCGSLADTDWPMYGKDQYRRGSIQD